MNRQFPIMKKEAEMDQKYFIKCSLSQVIREIHGKILIFQLTRVRTAIIDIRTNAGKIAGKEKALYTAGCSAN